VSRHAGFFEQCQSVPQFAVVRSTHTIVLHQADVFRFLIGKHHLTDQNAYVVLDAFNTGFREKDAPSATFLCEGEFIALPSPGLVNSWCSRNPDACKVSRPRHGWKLEFHTTVG